MENGKTKKPVKTWEELGLTDDFLFSKVMKDEKICKKLLETLLHTKIQKIVYLEEEKVVHIALKSKGVRLDVYIESENRVFNIEMQAGCQAGLAKRSRYYQSMIDLNILEAGEYYTKLKESYVIFICSFDPFGAKKAEYQFENICLGEDHKPLRLGDQTKKIFFNAKAYMKAEDKDIQEFLKYVDGQPSDNPFVQEIENKVAEVKQVKEWRQEYMKTLLWEQDIRQEAWQEAWDEASKATEEKTRKEDIRKLIATLRLRNMPDDTIEELVMETYHLTSEVAKSYLCGELATS
ncbi:Rpn family recombination-promoting nuclease/putative transposase [Lachnospiraceae bacterium ZAX-1]